MEPLPQWAYSDQLIDPLHHATYCGMEAAIDRPCAVAPALVLMNLLCVSLGKLLARVIHRGHHRPMATCKLF